MIKKTTLSLVLVIFLFSSMAFAVSNAKINGQKEVTITQLPADLVFTCDLASSGNRIALEYYIDLDNNGSIGPMEEVVEFFYLTDGIGWIKDPQNSDNDFAGDETGVDGKIQTTFTIQPDDVFIPSGFMALVHIIDEDGSEDFVKIHFQIEPQPPFIQGKVTDKATGAPIEKVFVMAMNEAAEETFYGMSDANGDYKVSVKNGTYKVVVMEFPSVNYQPSDTVTVTVSGDQNQTQDFQLEPFPSRIQGKLAKEDGTPVPGILVVALSMEPGNFFFSSAISDEQGNYSIGASAGRVVVSAPFLFNMYNENWPQDYYIEPEADTLDVAAGQTYTSDFVFKPYTSFVTGKCTTDDGSPLAGVMITGVSFNMQTFQIKFYVTTSDPNGDYRLGVMPGLLTSLTASKDGYEMKTPPTGYMQVNVLPNQTVSGKDFVMQTVAPLSISGTVTFSDGSAAQDVYVAAENFYIENPDGFLITYTDGSGNYLFENVLEGDYHMGVYYEGYSSDPPMRTFYLTAGFPLSGQDYVLSPGTGVAIGDKIFQPTKVQLFQNYPNPFNPTTQIQFLLPQAENVSLTIYNSAGQLVKILQNGRMSAGAHVYEWDGTDQFGRKVGSGIYFYQLKTDNFHQVKRMILTK